jgi:hypothetical protein
MEKKKFIKNKKMTEDIDNKIEKKIIDVENELLLKQNYNKKNEQYKYNNYNFFNNNLYNNNLDLSNDIRYGMNTRDDKKEYKKNKEEYINERQDYLPDILNNIQNPNNLILPFPRGGEITRKNQGNYKDLDKKKLKFNY